MAVIRWNPHTYNVPNGTKRKTRHERLALHAKLKLWLRDHPPKDMITIYYLFYDKDNPVITRAFSHYFLYDESDIFKLEDEN